MIAFNDDYMGRGLDGMIQQTIIPEPQTKHYTPGKIAYYTASVLTLGLPQTIRHGYKVLRNMNKPKSKYDSNLDLADAVGTGAVICGQLAAIYHLYSPLVEMLFK